MALMAFGYCEGLTEITIPGTIASIDPDAFYGCSNLKSIYIDVDENTALDKENNKWGAEGATVIWKNYYSISSDGVLERVTVAEDKFTGTVVIPSRIGGITVTAIANNGLIGCDFTSVTLSERITSIGEKAFLGCSALESIVIPSSVETISENAFSQCTSLKTIDIPEQVTSVEYRAFSGCTSLTAISIPSSVVPYRENTDGH